MPTNKSHFKLFTVTITRIPYSEVPQDFHHTGNPDSQWYELSMAYETSFIIGYLGSQTHNPSLIENVVHETLWQHEPHVPYHIVWR